MLQKLAYISTSLLLVSCYQDINSNSYDDSYSLTNGIDTSTPNGKRLSTAYNVLKDKCMSCHTGYHNKWIDYTTDAKWLNSGLVEPNNAFSSEIITKLKNMGGNMPKDNPQIPEKDFDNLVLWIEDI